MSALAETQLLFDFGKIFLGIMGNEIRPSRVRCVKIWWDMAVFLWLVGFALAHREGFEPPTL